MELTPYRAGDRTFLEGLLIKTAAGSQQLGYPRLHSCAELEQEYTEYPDSSLYSSVYLVTRHAKPVGVMGFLRDGDYSVLWGPVTLQAADYAPAIRLSVSFAKQNIQEKCHVFVHAANTVYAAELERFGAQVRSVQHVMCYDWSKHTPLPPDASDLVCLTSEQLAASQNLRSRTIELLREGFPGLESANDLVTELLHTKCSFWFALSHGTVPGVLIADESFANEARIEYLAVSKPYRRLGIATKMLRCFLQSVFVAHGCRNVNLTHDHKNSTAHSVYLKAGFYDETIYKECIL